MNGKYRYDLHVHTNEASQCAVSSPVEMADMYKEQGFDGIIITDHFYCGNTCVPRDLEWSEWLYRYKQSYVHAKEEGDKIGLDVFYGWEYTYKGIDFITLGLDNDWLLLHPEVRSIDITDYLKLVRDSGGYIIHAHPFREAGYIPYIRLMPRLVDAVEVINASRTQFENERALDYAKAYGLALAGGSDAHSNGWKRFAGIETNVKMNSVADIIEAVKRGNCEVISVDRK